jgi:alpha-D-ribose 1-methylphosphonate 5-triphosphate diphosphatase
MQNWIITGGQTLKPGGLTFDPLTVQDGKITSESTTNVRTYNACNCLVLPGIVDVHGDAFERVLTPRPYVSFPLELALRESDQQLIGNGITTAFHGLSASWEPGLRSVDTADGFLKTLSDQKTVLACDTYVNLRWETFCLDAEDQILSWLSENPSILLSVNDHLTAYRGLDENNSKIARMAERSGLSRAESLALIDTLWARADEVPGAVARLTAVATKLGRTVFAHDELTAQQRASNRAMGVSVSEFPMSTATAQAAIDAGEHVVLGAPNVLRGGSQNKAVDAEPAILSGLCTVLASDYYYPAQMAAAFALVDRRGLDLAQAWALVSRNPAQAVGLTDRGDFAEGNRADVLVVDGRTRQIRAVFVAGRKVYERE